METSCILWQKSITNSGYGKLTIRIDGVKKTPNAHKYYYEQKYGKIQKGLQIDHLCRQKLCINTDHMEIVTPAENSRRRLSSKITMKEAEEIRKLYKEKKLVQRELGIIYNLGQDEISRIINGRRWAQ